LFCRAWLTGHAVGQYGDGTPSIRHICRRTLCNERRVGLDFECHLHSVENSDQYRLTTIGFMPEGRHDEP
jgi:hypothetical protein